MPLYPQGGGLYPNSIDNVLLADMPDGTVKGRALGAGLGDPTDLTPAQLRTLLAAVNVPYGQCSLGFVSSTQLRLDRSSGCILTIDDTPQVIPAAGVLLGNGGLAASTLYYIYAYMAGAVMTLEAALNAYVTDPRNGMKVKNGDATRTLVGMARTSGGTPQFFDQNDARYTRTWFRDPGIVGTTFDIGSVAVSSTGWICPGGASIGFIAWAGETIRAKVSTSIYQNTANMYNAVGIGYDSATAPSPGYQYASPTGVGMYHTFAPSWQTKATEGFHAFYILGIVQGGQMIFGPGLMHMDSSGNGA